MEEITIENTEVIEENTEVVTDDMQIDELSDVLEDELVSTTVTYDDTLLMEQVVRIADGIEVLVLFAILTFCTACMRAWRNNVIKGAR